MIFGGLEHTQKDIALGLRSMVQSAGIPNALLFWGEPYSGRMYAARELCDACNVKPENVIIVSDRNHESRIRTALALYRKNRNASARTFLSDTVSVLLQQYHGALLEGISSTAGKKKFSDAADVSDILRELESCTEDKAPALADKLEKAVLPLCDANRTSSVSIAQVRAVRDWCATSAMDGSRKFVILEGLENAGEPAVNALLKILEEPPALCHFILISSNAGRIPATVLSRVRRFRFNSLDNDGLKYIFGSLFVDPSKYPDLESFFLQGSGADDGLLRECAAALLEKRDFDLPALAAELEKTQMWDRFFSLVLRETEKAFSEGRLGQRMTQYITDCINDAVIKGGTFNQTRRLTFDYVVFRIREVNR